MRRALLVTSALVAASLAATGAANAKHSWTGPGWYQVYGDIGGGLSLGGGPYSTEQGCNATLPPDDEGGGYDCRYFSQDPGYPDDGG